MRYVSIDGNGVGSIIESLIVDNRLEELSSLSLSITNTLNKVEAKLIQRGAKIYMCGGDNILAYVNFNDDLIKLIQDITSECPVNFSVGVGVTSVDAYLALKLAKIKKKDVYIIN